MNFEEWEKDTARGTSGDMIFEDWKKERKSQEKSEKILEKIMEICNKDRSKKYTFSFERDFGGNTLTAFIEKDGEGYTHAHVGDASSDFNRFVTDLYRALYFGNLGVELDDEASDK